MNASVSFLVTPGSLTMAKASIKNCTLPYKYMISWDFNYIIINSENNLHWYLQHTWSGIWHELQSAVLWELLWSKLFHILWANAEGVYTCSSERTLICLQRNQSFCTQCLSSWNPSLSCATCLDPSTNCADCHNRNWCFYQLHWLSQWKLWSLYQLYWLSQ